MSYKNRLEKLKSNWDSDKPVSGIQQLPKGKYQFVIKRAFLEQSQAKFNKGNICVVIEAHVLTGSYKGRKTILRTDLEAKANIDKGWPSGISRFKGMLETLKVDMPKSFAEDRINKTLKTLIGVCFNGSAVVNDKGYTNVYINDLISAASESEDDEDEIEDEEDEKEDEEEDEEDEDSEEDSKSDDDSESDDDEEDSDDDEDDDDEEEEPAKPQAKKPVPVKPKAAKKSDDEEGDDWEKEF